MKARSKKKYTALILALSLASPMIVEAASIEENPKATEITTEEKHENSLEIQSKMSLSEDKSQIVYDIDITNKNIQSQELSAYLYLPENSNIENLKLENSDIKANELATDLGKALAIKLAAGEKTSLKLSADIKKDKTDKLFFDLGLISKNNEILTKRIGGQIEADKLVEKTSEELAHVLAGKINEDKTITWTDYLLNSTEEKNISNYDFEISENQSFENEKINLEYFTLTSEGYKLTDSKALDFGNIKDLEIAPNSLVKISFKTKQLEDFGEFKINDASVLVKKEEDKKEDNKENTSDEEKALDAIKILEENSKEITDILLANEGVKENPKEDKEDKKEEPKEDKKEDKKDEKTAEEKTKELTDKLEENSAEIEKSLKTDASEEKAKELIDQIELTNDEIIKLLKDNETGFDKLIKTPDKKEEEPKTIMVSEDDKKANDLADKIIGYNKQIDSILEPILGKEEYQKLLKDAEKRLEKAKKISTKEEEKAKKEENSDEKKAQSLISQINDKNEEISEVVRQVKLREEVAKALADEKELEVVKSLLKGIEKLDKASKEVEESKKEAYVSPHFKMLLDDFSRKAYKDLEKVVTVTLDPLKKIEAKSTVDQAKKKYPTIDYYLSNLELRNDMLNNLGYIVK
ncbi:hypothetical protein [Anaerococcus sp. Marseille-P3625]|uniref:hypothetical protein n=1 Tax=Anaerococcus sp. Marseille-P3625 TaxID=1977277 RepID=UPI000C0788DB|nr:hypothetical protein [Anaerococcus sp. Marseille-P3625]